MIVASMGSFFSLQIVRLADNESVKKMIQRVKSVHSEFRLIGSTSHRQKAICEMDLSTPVMLLLGNETKGLSHAYKEACDELCTIPMAENSVATSFNVSCAASIMMYEVIRQRRQS